MAVVGSASGVPPDLDLRLEQTLEHEALPRAHLFLPQGTRQYLLLPKPRSPRRRHALIRAQHLRSLAFLPIPRGVRPKEHRLKRRVLFGTLLRSTMRPSLHDGHSVATEEPQALQVRSVPRMLLRVLIVLRTRGRHSVLLRPRHLEHIHHVLVQPHTPQRLTFSTAFEVTEQPDAMQRLEFHTPDRPFLLLTAGHVPLPATPLHRCSLPTLLRTTVPMLSTPISSDIFKNFQSICTNSTRSCISDSYNITVIKCFTYNTISK